MVWYAVLAKSALPSKQSSRKKKRGGREGKKECNKELKDATSWFRIFMSKVRDNGERKRNYKKGGNLKIKKVEYVI